MSINGFEPYQDIEEWDTKRLEKELEALFKDKQEGLMSEDLYRDCYDMILGELLKREDEEELSDAYDRAMKGI